MKRAITTFLTILLILTGLIPASAIHTQAKEQPNCEQESEEDWRMLWQGDPRWGSNMATTERTFTVADAGCLMMSVMMLMAYDKVELRNWDVFNPYIATMPEPKMSSAYQWKGYPEYDLPGTAFDCVERDRSVPSSVDEKAKLIKKIMEEEELYVVIWTGSHYVACTGWNADKEEPILQDSGGPGYDARKNTENNWQTYGSQIIKLQVYKGERKPTETLIGYSDDFSVSKVKREVKEGVYELNGQFYSERDLPGMEEIESYIIHNQIIIDPMNKSELTYREQQSLALLKADVEQSRMTMPKFLTTGVSIAALLMAVYALLLLLGLAFDTANTLLDFSLVEILTLGKIRIGDSDENYAGYVDGVRTLSKKQFLTVVAVILLLSVGLLAGWVQKLLYFISEYFY